MKKGLLIVFLSVSALLCAHNYNLSRALEAIQASNFEKALDYVNRDISDFPDKAESRFQRAFIYYKQERNREALTELSAVFALTKPADKEIRARIYNLRGEIYASVGNPEKAIANFSSAIRLNPKVAEYYLNRAQACFGNRQYDRAEADYQQVLLLNEGEMSAQIGLARICMAKNQFAKAEKKLYELTALFPGKSEPFFYLAQSCYAQKQTDNAIVFMFQAVRQDEQNDSALTCFQEYAKNNFRLAMAHVSTMLVSQPDNVSWLLLRGKIAEENRQYRPAISDFSRGLKAPDGERRLELLYHRAMSYMECGEYPKAIADFSEAIAVDSTSEYLWAYRGYAKQYLPDFAGAKSDFSRAIDINPLDGWFYYRRGWLNDDFLKLPDAALEDYNQAIALDKTLFYPLWHRGRLYQSELKDTAMARKDYETLLQNDTTVSNSSVRHFALMALGHHTEAEAWMKKIIAAYPTAGSYYDAACLYADMKRPEQAVNALKMALEKGYVNFSHIASDDDLDDIRNLPEFTAAVDKWHAKFMATQIGDVVADTLQQHVAPQTVVMPMIPNDGGTYTMPCRVNGLPLNFTFDTGACEVSVSQTEVQFMLKNNYLKPADLLGTERYTFANGDVGLGTRLILRKVDIGGFILYNVPAVVVDSKKAPLLFGQSALSKYGKIVIDNDAKTITISR